MTSNPNAIEIIKKLKRSGLDVTEQGFGINIKAQTKYSQYIIYLTSSHLYDDPEHLSGKIEETLNCTVENVSSLSYRKRGVSVTEVWVFVNFENTGADDSGEKESEGDA